LLLALALPMAAVEDDQVMYAGGTAPALRMGVVGRLEVQAFLSDRSAMSALASARVLCLAPGLAWPKCCSRAAMKFPCPSAPGSRWSCNGH